MGTALTAVDLKALRTAEDLVFRCKDGASTIECTKKVTGDPWEKEKRHHIAVESYGAKEAFEYCNSSQYDAQLRTTLKHLKAGDLVTLLWRPDYGSNGYSKDCGLHVDVLVLEVRKEEKPGKDVYHIATSLCPDNSARMIRA